MKDNFHCGASKIVRLVAKKHTLVKSTLPFKLVTTSLNVNLPPVPNKIAGAFKAGIEAFFQEQACGFVFSELNAEAVRAGTAEAKRRAVLSNKNWDLEEAQSPISVTCEAT